LGLKATLIEIFSVILSVSILAIGTFVNIFYLTKESMMTKIMFFIL